MEELFNLGISENTIENMLEFNPNLKDLSNIEIQRNIKLLENIGCSKNDILNIISSNTLYLFKSENDIINLIDYLKKIGFISLSILFEANPYILNLENYEIENYINNRKEKGEEIEDIIDDLDSNPYLFNEI